MPDGKIVLTPQIMRSLKEICYVFGVSEETVREWKDSGAPIVTEGSGVKTRYSAEVNALQVWRLKNSN